MAGIPRSQPQPEAHQLGAMIAAAREKAGLTQTELAARINAARTNLSKIESGEYVPGPERLTIIARALNIDPSPLLDLAGCKALAEELRMRRQPAAKRHLFADNSLSPQEAKELLRYLGILRGQFQRS